MRQTLYAKERLELTNRRPVSQQEPNLSSCLELKQKHRDTGEGKTRKGINNLEGISGVGDIGKERGKNHQRNGGGCPSAHESTLVAPPELFLRGQKLPLSLGHFCHEALEKPPFLDPCLHLLTKFHRNIQGTGAIFFLPREQSHLMKGSFLATSASRIATAFFCKSKGGLDKGLYLPKPFQSRFSPVAGHSMTCHRVSIYTYLILVNKKMMPLRKNILRSGRLC